MILLPSPDVLGLFTLASLVLIFTPGPDMTLFLGQTLTGGRARGLAAMFGASTGTLVHSMLAAFGLSTLLAASTTAFMAVKIAGVLYLLWLATMALRHGSGLGVRAVPSEKRPLREVYLMGLGINLFNPKVVLFFVTFLPQFVSPTDSAAGVKLFFLGLYFVALAIPICAALIFAADRLTGAARRSPRVVRDRLAVRGADGSICCEVAAVTQRLMPGDPSGNERQQDRPHAIRQPA